MCADCDWPDFIKGCKAILLDVEEMPERAEEFGESVREKIESMLAFAEEREHVTDKQREAVDNMGSAVRRWLR